MILVKHQCHSKKFVLIIGHTHSYFPHCLLLMINIPFKPNNQPRFPFSFFLKKIAVTMIKVTLWSCEMCFRNDQHKVLSQCMEIKVLHKMILYTSPAIQSFFLFTPGMIDILNDGKHFI